MFLYTFTRPKNLLIIACLLVAYPGLAQQDVTEDVYEIIRVQDSLLFDLGFGQCDTDLLEELVSDDFEYYHDQSGVLQSKSTFIEDFQEGICKLDYQPRRELVEVSMRLFPLYDDGVLYGVLQNGEHRFWADRADRPSTLTSSAQFSHLWLLEEVDWKLSRVLSYDHRKLEVINMKDP